MEQILVSIVAIVQLEADLTRDRSYENVYCWYSLNDIQVIENEILDGTVAERRKFCLFQPVFMWSKQRTEITSQLFIMYSHIWVGWWALNPQIHFYIYFFTSQTLGVQN